MVLVNSFYSTETSRIRSNTNRIEAAIQEVATTTYESNYILQRYLANASVHVNLINIAQPLCPKVCENAFDAMDGWLRFR